MAYKANRRVRIAGKDYVKNQPIPGAGSVKTIGAMVALGWVSKVKDSNPDRTEAEDLTVRKKAEQVKADAESQDQTPDLSILDASIPAIETSVATITNETALRAILAAEECGKTRKGVVSVILSRLTAIAD